MDVMRRIRRTRPTVRHSYAPSHRSIADQRCLAANDRVEFHGYSVLETRVPRRNSTAPARVSGYWPLPQPPRALKRCCSRA